MELGFFFCALGPDKVFVFQREAPADTTFLPRLERPSDLDGRMFLAYDASGAWRERLRSRLADHGFELLAP
jgi:predicted nucleotide-binding protein